MIYFAFCIKFDDEIYFIYWPYEVAAKFEIVGHLCRFGFGVKLSIAALQLSPKQKRQDFHS